MLFNESYRAEEKRKALALGRKIKLSLFADGFISYQKDPKFPQKLANKQRNKEIKPLRSDNPLRS